MQSRLDFSGRNACPRQTGKRQLRPPEAHEPPERHCAPTDVEEPIALWTLCERAEEVRRGLGFVVAHPEFCLKRYAGSRELHDLLHVLPFLDSDADSGMTAPVGVGQVRAKNLNRHSAGFVGHDLILAQSTWEVLLGGLGMRFFEPLRLPPDGRPILYADIVIDRCARCAVEPVTASLLRAMIQYLSPVSMS